MTFGMYAGKVSFDPASNENNYRFISAHWEWHTALAGLKQLMQQTREAAQAERVDSLFGFGIVPNRISVQCSLQDARAGLKIALATLTMAIIAVSANNYHTTGVSMVCMVMGGNQLGSSFSKSYTRLGFNPVLPLF
jgi:hypothetical protein